MDSARADLPATSVPGMPRIGPRRELKRALEAYWGGRASPEALAEAGAGIRRANWQLAAGAGIDLVPSNDFSLYDQVLDAAVLVGAVPERYRQLGAPGSLDAYFAMARGAGVGDGALEPLRLTKWFGTNYHHLVPELASGARFALSSSKPFDEHAEAAALGIPTKPVLLGPLTLCRLSQVSGGGSGAGPGPVPQLVEVYAEILARLAAQGAAWVEFDEPILSTDLGQGDLDALSWAYRRLGEASPRPGILLCTSYGDVGPAMGTLVELPVEGIGLDLCAGADNVEALSAAGGLGKRLLLAGVVDGQRPWAGDLATKLDQLESLSSLAAGVVVSTSTSLMHLPVSLDGEGSLRPEVRSWLAFAKEKLSELAVLAKGLAQGRQAIATELEVSEERRRRQAGASRNAAVRRRVGAVRRRVGAVRRAISGGDQAEPEGDPLDRRPGDPLDRRPGDPLDRRAGTPESRAAAQAERLKLPVLPLTTIGSFPQTAELRAARAAHLAGTLDGEAYAERLRQEVARAVALQEKLGLDVLVHGEPERDDMVRYFAAQLDGFALTQEGWVQSYGSRCVRPPILYGDVQRRGPISVAWSTYAASLTGRPVKAMLTGPLTMLAWSFPRSDLPREEVAYQLAMALSDEVADLVAAGMAVIQVDEPGLAELVPLQANRVPAYLEWATRAFRLVVAAAPEDVQVHTHMCYADFGVLLPALAELEVDVVSMEAVRSAMALVGLVAGNRLPLGVGPGVYDVHAPRVPEVEEVTGLLSRAVAELGPDRVWVNPDCGLKTRSYPQVEAALANLVAATRQVRQELALAEVRD